MDWRKFDPLNPCPDYQELPRVAFPQSTTEKFRHGFFVTNAKSAFAFSSYPDLVYKAFPNFQSGTQVGWGDSSDKLYSSSNFLNGAIFLQASLQESVPYGTNFTVIAKKENTAMVSQLCVFTDLQENGKHGNYDDDRLDGFTYVGRGRLWYGNGEREKLRLYCKQFHEV